MRSGEKRTKSHVGRPRRDGQAPISKKKIMEAAGGLFGRKGYGGTSIRMICDELNATPSSIFHHFPTKQKIIEEVFSYIIDDDIEFYERVAATGASAAVQLYEIVTVDFQSVSNSSPALRKVLGLPQVRDPEFESIYKTRQRIFKHLEKLIKMGIKEGSFRALNAALIAEAVGLLAELPVYSSKVRRGRSKDARVIADFMFLGMLKNPQELDEITAEVREMRIPQPTVLKI